jgi:hypothetical protein
MVEHGIAAEIAMGAHGRGAARGRAQRDLGQRQGQDDPEDDQDGQGATPRAGPRPSTPGSGRYSGSGRSIDT